MMQKFPPSHGRLTFTEAEWNRLVEEQFFPVGPFEFADDIIDDFVNGGDFWSTFTDPRVKKMYKWKTDAGRVIVEPVHEDLDQ